MLRIDKITLSFQGDYEIFLCSKKKDKEFKCN